MSNKTDPKKTILLAYSGGLDTSAILVWLRNQPNVGSVITYLADCGGDEVADIPAIKDRALSLGADRFIAEDLRENFAQDYIGPMVRMAGLYEGTYRLGTAIARPLIAERMVAVARAEGVTAVCHGATGKGNDQLRFERSWALLAPDLEILSPWRQWQFKGRADLLAYLDENGFDFNAPNKTFSIDSNLAHTSYEGHFLENPANAVEDGFWQKIGVGRTQERQRLELGFDRGRLINVDGQCPSVATLIEELNKLGLRFGIGVDDIVENRMNGLKSRGVYLSPGLEIISKALTALKQLVWSHETFQSSRIMGDLLAERIYQGRWHSEDCQGMLAYFDFVSQHLTGSVTLDLLPGAIRLVSRRSEYSCYRSSIVSFDDDLEGLNRLADGFCYFSMVADRTRGLMEASHGGA